jgi:hypothetical protein
MSGPKHSLLTTTDLDTLIKNLSPKTLPATYVFCTIPGAAYGAMPHTHPLACFVEPEGLTLVLTQESADLHDLPYQGTFHCISLQVHSSLDAVGLTATVASELATHGISANVIAGFYHDHVFVSSMHSDHALSLLESMSTRR